MFSHVVFHLLNVAVLVSAYTPLSDHFIKLVPSGGPDFEPDNGLLLAPILTPRVPGTPSHSAVQHHFVNFFTTELPKWSLEWQNSSSSTPVTKAVLPFANLIFTREPPWTKSGPKQKGHANFLTLAAHYDSKSLQAAPGFVGATESAASCAVLMHVARSIDEYMTQMHDEMDALGEGGTVEMDMAVQIIFLDGREAFGKEDTESDGLYGSRYELQLQFSDGNVVTGTPIIYTCCVQIS
jgi:glutaminyl-peptide cyclotransferase